MIKHDITLHFAEQAMWLQARRRALDVDMTVADIQGPVSI